jgi:hypothetical protein
MIDSRKGGPDLESQETGKDSSAVYPLPQRALDKINALVRAGFPWLYNILPASYIAIMASIPVWLTYISAALFSHKLALTAQEESIAQMARILPPGGGQ